MKYKMLVTDLDGTLLNSRSQITPEVKKAVAYARERGVYVILCSGRCCKPMIIFERMLGPIPDAQLGISFNGGMTYESATQRVLTDYRLERGLAFEIIDSLKSKGAPVLIYQGCDLYAENNAAEIIAYCRGAMLPVTMLSDFRELRGDISKVLIRSDRSVIGPLEESVRGVARGRCSVYFSAHNLLEYCPLEANKGAGLKYVCGYLGISPDEVIAAGDQNNDISMLREAGLGIAVGNATEETKGAANITIRETNDEGAVAAIIYKYF